MVAWYFFRIGKYLGGDQGERMLVIGLRWDPRDVVWLVSDGFL